MAIFSRANGQCSVAHYFVKFFPSASLGADIYHRKGHETHGFPLGISMFLVAIALDAIFTVPFIIMPYGGNYISFFIDPSFG